MDVFLAACLGILVALGAHAAPPVDLSDFDGTKAPPTGTGEKKAPAHPGIGENQMIYLDNTEGVEGASKNLRRVRINVAGRDRPGREGKVLLRLAADQRVKHLRDSKDGRWSLVEIVSAGKKAWVPKAALEAPNRE